MLNSSFCAWPLSIISQPSLQSLLTPVDYRCNAHQTLAPEFRILSMTHLTSATVLLIIHFISKDISCLDTAADEPWRSLSQQDIMDNGKGLLEQSRHCPLTSRRLSEHRCVKDRVIKSVSTRESLFNLLWDELCVSTKQNCGHFIISIDENVHSSVDATKACQNCIENICFTDICTTSNRSQSDCHPTSDLTFAFGRVVLDLD